MYDWGGNGKLGDLYWIVFYTFFHENIYKLAKLEQLIKIGFCVSLGSPKFRIGLYVCFVHTALCCLFITHIHSQNRHMSLGLLSIVFFLCIVGVGLYTYSFYP